MKPGREQREKNREILDKTIGRRFKKESPEEKIPEKPAKKPAKKKPAKKKKVTNGDN